jgi:hypothetical protein
VARVPFDPPYTRNDVPELDRRHKAIGLGEEWLTSDRRQELLHSVPITISRGGRRVVIGVATSQGNGHFEARLGEMAYHYVFAEQTGVFEFDIGTPPNDEGAINGSSRTHPDHKSR